MTYDSMWRARRQVKERARRKLKRTPARAQAGDERVRQIQRGARPDRRSDRHRAPALELEPERVDITVVMQPHAFPAPPLDREQERALLARRPQQRRPQGDHQPGEPRQHLVDLREEHRAAFAKRAAQDPGIARAVVAALDRRLKRHAGPSQGEDGIPIGRDRAPAGAAWREHDRRTSQRPAPEPREGSRAREPARERRTARVQSTGVGARGVACHCAGSWP